MKKIAFFMTFLLLLSSCGEDSNQTQAVAEEMNLFSTQALSTDQIENPNSIIGLWQSSEYEHNGITMQVRWRVSENETIVAKKCKISEDLVYYAQVSAPVNTNVITQNNATTSTVSLSSVNRRTDIVEMPDGKVCRASLDPKNGDNQSIIEGTGDEFLMSGNNISGGSIEMLYVQEARTGHLIKIGN